MPKMLKHLTRLPTELRHCLRRLAAAAVLLGLAACGPGTGGTGTGPVQTLSISFSATVISGAVVATAGGAPVAPGGPVCSSGCDRISLRLDAAQVELTAPCSHFAYSGPWAPDADGLLLLSGTQTTTTAAGTTTTAAQLRLQFSERTTASAQVTYTLSSDTGATLLGPASLLRDTQATTAAPSVCSPAAVR